MIRNALRAFVPLIQTLPFAVHRQRAAAFPSHRENFFKARRIMPAPLLPPVFVAAQWQRSIVQVPEPAPARNQLLMMRKINLQL